MTRTSSLVLQHVDCHLCGSDDYEIVDAHRGDRYWPPELEVRTVICRRCGLIYVNPQADEQVFKELYEGDYAGVRSSAPESTYVEAKDEFAERKVEWMLDQEAELCRPGRILDIGCAAGNFLASFKGRGWECMGVEPTPVYAKHARERYGLDVKEGMFDPADYAPESVDLVTLCEVLEHLRDPMEALTGAHRILRPDGFLYLDVPNALRPKFFRLSRFFRGEHLTNFSPHMIRLVLRRAGFDVVAHRPSLYQLVLARRLPGPVAIDFEREGEDYREVLRQLHWTRRSLIALNATGRRWAARGMVRVGGGRALRWSLRTRDILVPPKVQKAGAAKSGR